MKKSLSSFRIDSTTTREALRQLKPRGARKVRVVTDDGHVKEYPAGDVEFLVGLTGEIEFK